MPTFKERKIAELKALACWMDNRKVVRLKDAEAFISETIEEMENKAEKGMCAICGKETHQIFGINFVATSLCKDCEYVIVKQSVMDIYNIKNI